MLRLDGSAARMASKPQAASWFGNFMYNAENSAFVVDGTKIPLQEVGRHFYYDEVPTGQNNALSMVQINAKGKLFVARALHTWAAKNTSAVRSADSVMRAAYNTMIEPRKPCGATGFAADVIRRPEGIVGIVLRVPGFVTLRPENGTHDTQTWVPYEQSRPASTIAERNTLAAGIGHVAALAQADFEATLQQDIV